MKPPRPLLPDEQVGVRSRVGQDMRRLTSTASPTTCTSSEPVPRSDAAKTFSASLARAERTSSSEPAGGGMPNVSSDGAERMSGTNHAWMTRS